MRKGERGRESEDRERRESERGRESEEGREARANEERRAREARGRARTGEMGERTRKGEHVRREGARKGESEGERGACGASTWSAEGFSRSARSRRCDVGARPRKRHSLHQQKPHAFVQATVCTYLLKGDAQGAANAAIRAAGHQDHRHGVRGHCSEMSRDDHAQITCFLRFMGGRVG